MFHEKYILFKVLRDLNPCLIFCLRKVEILVPRLAMLLEVFRSFYPGKVWYITVTTRDGKPSSLHDFNTNSTEYEGVSKSFRTESIRKYTLTTISTR